MVVDSGVLYCPRGRCPSPTQSNDGELVLDGDFTGARLRIAERVYAEFEQRGIDAEMVRFGGAL